MVPTRRSLPALVAVVLSVSASGAVDVPVAARKLVVVDKRATAGTAKMTFVARDAAIGKGSATEPADIGAMLDVVYDGVEGRFAMPRGAWWVVNSSTVAKYVNAGAPAGGAVKVTVVKPGSLLKVVGKSLGEVPLDVSAAPSGPVFVAVTVGNGSETIRHCTQFPSCAHTVIAGGTGAKLVCKDGIGDPTCEGALPARCGDGAATVGESCDAPGTACGPGLLCDGRCFCHACGNTAVEEGEQCDDGNAMAGDGCDAACQDEEEASGVVSAGGSVTSDGEADGATTADPVETTVTSPVAGSIAVIETSPTSAAPLGLGLLDRLVTIDAPIASASVPLVLEFVLDASLLPAGTLAGTIVVFRDGVAVAECGGSLVQAVPDPCVSARLDLPGGDVALTVLSSHASGWGFGANVVLTFTSGAPVGTCGALRTGGAGGTVVRDLACGGLNLGGGNSTIVETGFPAGARTELTGTCAGDACVVTARTGVETGSIGTCSDTGCRFGPYLPVSNSGTSACLQQTFTAPVSGTLDNTQGAFTGSFPLASAIYLTANGGSPCPTCDGGNPGVLASGICSPTWTAATGPSPDAGEPCTPVNAAGDTLDCDPPAAGALPPLELDMAALTTDTAILTGASGLFCPSQAQAGAFGCHGVAASICPAGAAGMPDHLVESGMATGALTPGPHPWQLASTFCVPAVTSTLGFLVNAAADLPGPGATSLTGTLEVVSVTTSTSTTTTTIVPQGGTLLRFVSGPPSGTCGTLRTGGANGTVVKDLGCGGLNGGGGNSTLVESGVVEGAETFFNAACAGAICTVTARTAAETGDPRTCSDTSCAFGAYLPVVNGGSSACLRSSFAAPASGTLGNTLGTFMGSLPLSSAIYLTANAASPCPLCMGGSPGVPDSGSCDVGWMAGAGNPYPDAGAACTPINAAGGTHDCAPPAATALPALTPDLTPIGTATATMSDAAGLFCPSQTSPGAFGCHGVTSASCPAGASGMPDHIAAVGVAAGGLIPGPHPIVLASVFCIPTVGGSNGFLVNAAADLPGPGAITLPGSIELLP